MRVISVQSGSNGNCIYVEAGGARLLFDAGISGVQAQQRLQALGCDIKSVDAVLVSHDHADHSRSVGIFQRKFGLPICITAATYQASCKRHRLGKVNDLRWFEAGDSIPVRDAVVHTVATPHDGVDGVAFVVDDGSRRLGILTDLGHVFDGLPELLATLDGVLLESNYDPDMLRCGRYPEMLKRRIRGRGGHLSNGESAGLLGQANGRLRWACLGHLSEENNHPDLVLQAHQKALDRRLPLHVASRYQATGPMTL